MKYVITTTVAAVLLTGCSFSGGEATKNIKPIENMNEIKEICVYKPEVSLLDYDDASNIISNKLTELNIKHKFVEKDLLEVCTYKLSYTVKRAGIPLYLANAFFIVEKGHQEVGHAKYYYSVKGLTISGERTKGTDEKINELLTSLFVK